MLLLSFSVGQLRLHFWMGVATESYYSKAQGRVEKHGNFCSLPYWTDKDLLLNQIFFFLFSFAVNLGPRDESIAS